MMMNTKMNSDPNTVLALTDEVKNEVARVIRAAYQVSTDIGKQVEVILAGANEKPLTDEELAALLTNVVEVLKRAAVERQDAAALAMLQGDIQHIVSRLVQHRDSTAVVGTSQRHKRKYRSMLLNEYAGVVVGPVQPRPCFHGREVAVNSGYVATRSLALWDDNARLDIYLNDFRYRLGRNPNPDELLEMMLCQDPKDGVSKQDAFKIVDLARSIADNGVRKPPILDVDGTILDGNRRVTACYYVLNSTEFTSEQKKRAEYIIAWQLTEHATDDDRERVVVSLNFEDDCKEPWPEYVKARKVFDEWQAMLALEYPAPSAARQREMRQELARKFASRPTDVARYLKMVLWATDFENYLIEEVGKDTHEVKLRANQEFQYFEELSKGVRVDGSITPGSVAHTLTEDEQLKHLAYDLLFQDKFKNWDLIRDLKYASRNAEAMELLRTARDYEVRVRPADLKAAQKIVEDALVIAKAKEAEEKHAARRSLGANQRIEIFVTWLEGLPVSAFRDDISTENLLRLLRALELVRAHAEDALKTRRAQAQGK
jgi:hypothetical protein